MQDEMKLARKKLLATQEVEKARTQIGVMEWRKGECKV